MLAELKHLEQSNQRTVHWKRRGPSASDLGLSTAPEYSSANGDAWNTFRMTLRAPKRTGGTRTALRVSVIAAGTCVSR
jgi:hypothetical protein